MRFFRSPATSTRVHIVGISPRTGTTLMAELMISCFRFDGWSAHEMRLRDVPDPPVDLLCTKKPSDIHDAAAFLARDPNLWIICMLRDPRDIVVSRHARRPDRYWSHLGLVRPRCDLLETLKDHPRFIPIRYEDLVTNPNAVQDRLHATMPFLQQRHQFSDFHRVAKPSDASVTALNGLRPVTNSGIGRWRSDLPRLTAQLEKLGPIDDMLRTMGYEDGPSWTAALSGITPDNGVSQFDEDKGDALNTTRPSLLERARTFVRAGRYDGEPQKIVLAATGHDQS